MNSSTKIIACAAAAAAGLLTLSGVGAAPLESNPVPSFNSTSGNPYTDANGNQWTVCQVAYTGVDDGGAWGANLPTTGGWVPMTLSGNTYYGNNLNYQSAPNVSGTTYFVERSYDNNANYNGGLIFKPDVAGTYSWQGTISHNDWGNGVSNNNPADIVFGKFDAAGNWSLLLETIVPNWWGDSYLDVTAQNQLQNIALQTGDTLVVAVKTGYADDKGTVDFGDASINLVPEPASLALLALGGLALFRRRR